MPEVAEAQAATATGNTTVVTTTETVAASSGEVSVDAPDRQVVLIGFLQLTAGTGATGATPRIRRGADATGTLVGEGNAETVVAANTVGIVVMVVDENRGPGTFNYVLTVQQAAATGNGTVLLASLVALVL